jgi:hypothetical protein
LAAKGAVQQKVYILNGGFLGWQVYLLSLEEAYD